MCLCVFVHTCIRLCVFMCSLFLEEQCAAVDGPTAKVCLSHLSVSSLSQREVSVLVYA